MKYDEVIEDIEHQFERESIDIYRFNMIANFFNGGIKFSHQTNKGSRFLLTFQINQKERNPAQTIFKLNQLPVELNVNSSDRF